MTDTASPLARLLISEFFASPDGTLTDTQRADLEVHLTVRCAKFRAIYAPWLTTMLVPADRVLEIGAGTGCVSLVLAEAQVRLDAIEPHPGHARVAAERLRAAGHSYGRLITGAIPAALGEVAIGDYQAIVFGASLEHMTLTERLEGLRQVWKSMRPGMRLIIVECPNRLWFTDSHTGGMEFYHWVPDELLLAQQVHGCTDQASLYRVGRAASFHDLRAAGIPVGTQACIDSLQLWSRRRSVARRIKWLLVASAGRYERLLHRNAAHIHRAFFHEYLDIALVK